MVKISKGINHDLTDAVGKLLTNITDDVEFIFHQMKR